MIPVARTENLLLQDIGNELIIYDQDNNSSHCLTPLAVRVWELSNGQNTVNDIAHKLEKEFNLPGNSDVDMRGLVWLTLEELERYSLIQEYLRQPATNVIAGMSRRKAIKTATLVGGFAIGSMFPVVKSIVAPEPALASSGSGACRTERQTCNVQIEGTNKQNNCCAGLICTPTAIRDVCLKPF
ncbi:PqqD family peptide modification chaperone [Planktothrix sp. FACHB-1365]|uniref:PqqD family peptide modification chaperone n=1 Tax=Planktothrix sp. FACHB-1365 TaxID=2692855 RepID=UPI001685CBFA|nr:PqqD family peptide modification chaperone [Planktothrix sp. FACHB-1365]MBD2482468.1 PqqD family peptide modification chaperone [Planktothrix sp. FACHB-1365]